MAHNSTYDNSTVSIIKQDILQDILKSDYYKEIILFLFVSFFTSLLYFCKAHLVKCVDRTRDSYKNWRNIIVSQNEVII